MEILIDNKFHTISYDKDSQICYHITKATTIAMLEDDFRQMLLTWKELVMRVGPRLLLVDNREFNFPVSPDLQTWAAKNINVPVMALDNVQKFCFIMPEEFVANLSIVQLTTETSNMTNQAQIEYFSELEEGKTWLLAQ